MTKQLVSLFIVGQPKSGTTALATFLGQHPDICMSTIKEPGYFATDLIQESDTFHGRQAYYHVRTPEKYGELFAQATNQAIWGEASTNYLYSKEAAKNICTYNPKAKIVMLLREPVDFMHSLHMQYTNETAEDESDFVAALNKEANRKKGYDVPRRAWCPSYLFYRERIKYAEQIKRYLDLFPREQIFIGTMNDLRADSSKIYREVLEFLGIDACFKPNFGGVHESKKPRFVWLNRWMHNPRFKKIMHGLLGPYLFTRIQKRLVEKVLLKKQKRKPISAELRAQLKAQIRPEVLKTSRLIGRDLAKEWGY